MAKVDLIYFTGKDTPDEMYYAARLLAFTKGTRLQMTPDGLDQFLDAPVDNIKDELSYMAATIASSWEFVDVIFSIRDVSRACAQQITRTRTASYAMQSQRVTDMSEVTFHIPDTVTGAARVAYESFLKGSRIDYQSLVHDMGVSKEDARGVLPINAHCNLIAKYNLRSWVDLVRSRQSLRVQGEYQDIARQMKEAVLAVWPWASTFVEPKSNKAIAMIEEVAKSELLSAEMKMQLAKAADLIKKEGA
jgi:flavin-dependent thymidylate synthase